MDKLKSRFGKIKLSFKKKKDVEISTSAEPNLAGCPEVYVEPNLAGCPEVYVAVPLFALQLNTRNRLAEYLDKKGKLVKVEIGVLTKIVIDDENVPTEIMNDVTGLTELSRHEDYLDFNIVDVEKQPKSPTIALINRWANHGGQIGKFWEYLLILQRHDVIQDCRQLIMSDCQTYLGLKKNPALGATGDPTEGATGYQRW